MLRFPAVAASFRRVLYVLLVKAKLRQEANEAMAGVLSRICNYLAL